MNYFENGDFDGMIIFTDGFAPKPKVRKPHDILWVLTDERSYDFENWLLRYKQQSVILRNCDLNK